MLRTSLSILNEFHFTYLDPDPDCWIDQDKAKALRNNSVMRD